MSALRVRQRIFYITAGLKSKDKKTTLIYFFRTDPPEDRELELEERDGALEERDEPPDEREGAL